MNQEEEVRANLLKEEKKGTIQIIKPETAQIMISMLRTVIDGGTGRAASLGPRGKQRRSDNRIDVAVMADADAAE